MTIGTKTTGALKPARALDWVTNQSNNVGGYYGSLHTKSWSGGDSFPSRKSSRRAGSPAKVVYSPDGPETYYPTPFRRPTSPNGWECTFTDKVYPEGEYLWYKYRRSDGAFVDRYGYKQISWDSVYATSPPEPPLLSPDDQYKLISRVANQIRGNSFNAAVAGSQSLQSVAMIRDGAIRLANAMRLTKRGDLYHAWIALTKGREARYHRRVLDRTEGKLRMRKPWDPDHVRNDKDLANNWLELQYGWLPLLSDVHDAAVLLAHQQTRTLKQKYRSSVKAQVDYSGNWFMSRPGTGTGGTVMSKATAEVSRRIVVEISAPPNMSSILGLQNPASVAWELTPWSFVVDWFIPIGDFLQASADVRMLNISRVVTTTVKKRHVSGPVMKSYSDSLYDYRLVSFSGLNRYSQTITSYERTVGATLSVPLPSFKPLSEVVGWKRALNAVALFKTRLQ